MNYLAHILLSLKDEECILGNFMGDFMKGVNINRFNDKIKSGILRHRAIDSFTDRNSIFIKSKRRISDENKKFAGVLVDIFYDHFLAKNWYDYSVDEFDEYIEKFYVSLVKYKEILPIQLASIVDKIINSNLFYSYNQISGIEIVLKRLAMRSDKYTFDKTGINDLINNYEQLENDFKQFMIEIQEFLYNYDLKNI